MTELLDQAIQAARNLPASVQDEIARIVLHIADFGREESDVTLSDDERAAIAASKSAAGHGQFASEEEVRAVWAKHGL